MTVTKPGNYLDWVPSANPLYIQDPTSGQKSTGWVANEKPPFEYMNWLFYYTDQWIQWFDQTLTPPFADGVTADPTVFVTTGNVTNGTRTITGLANVTESTTGDTTNNSNLLTNIASTSGIIPGMKITGTGIPSNTFVEEINGTTITMTKDATANGTVVALTFDVNLPVGLGVSGTGIPSGTYIVAFSGTTATISQAATATTVGATITFAHSWATGSDVQVQLDQLDAIANYAYRNGPFDVITGVTHQTLAAAVADGAVTTNKRVLLGVSETLASSVTLSKAGWRITALPGVTLTDGGAGTGLIAAAARVEFDHLRFSGFTTAIQFNGSSSYGRALFCNFLSCATEVDDTLAPTPKPIPLGNITE